MKRIFSDELDLKDRLLDNKVSFASQLRKSELSEDQFNTLKVAFPKAIATNLEQPDLYYMDSILVSVGINKNDDYFDSEEVWAARKSPEDKQINYEHNEKDIIGHITSCYAVDHELRRIPEDVPVDRLPKKYHIVTGGVLYKKWEDEELHKRMDSILEDIDAGEIYVSMECLFNDFDYILIEDTGKASIVSREAATSYLTKYLRAYGGDGVYQNKRIGRVIRNITFSGKGIVKKPANPDSIIFNSTSPVVVKANEINGEQNTMAKLETDVTVDVKPDAELQAMASQIKELTQLLADEKKAKAEAKAQAEKDAKATADAEVKNMADSLKTKDEEINSLKAKLVDSEKALEASAQKLEDAEKASKAASDEIAKIKADQKKADRVAQLVKAGKTQEDAVKLEVKFASVDDEAFAAILENFAVAADPDEDEDDDEDEAEANADATVLEKLEVTKTQAGAKGKGDVTKYEETFKSIASMFGNYSKYNKTQKSDE